MPQHVRRRALDPARLLVHARLRERVAQRTREHAHDGPVLAREVVELDRLGHAVRVFGRARGALEDVLVVRARVVELKQWRALLDRAALCAGKGKGPSE